MLERRPGSPHEPLTGRRRDPPEIVRRARDAPILRNPFDRAALHLARHQMPRRWCLVDDIPRTSRGKVNRSDVARRCAALAPVDRRGSGGGERGSAGA